MHVGGWLAEVNRHASVENCKKLLIGNKSDRKDKAVSSAEGEVCVSVLGHLLLVVVCSSCCRACVAGFAYSSDLSRANPSHTELAGVCK